MDHLPPVVGHRIPLLTVPCVCDPMCFDGMQWESFPTRKGFRLISQDAFPSYLLNSDGSRLTSRDLAAIAQAWLFFGLLIEVLKVSDVLVDVKQFVRWEGGNKFVTTKALPGYLSEWERKERLLSEKERKAHYRRQQDLIMNSIHFRYRQVSGQRFPNDSFSLETPKESYIIALPWSIAMSIVILEETLERASRRAHGNVSLTLLGPEMPINPVVKELKARKWCPSEISLVLEGFDSTSAFFASQLDRRRLEADHSKCSINKCLAFNIVTEQYETKHVASCQGCQDIGIDGPKLASILHRGQIPRAYVQLTGNNDTAQIKLIIGDSGPYVAVSHVWSDGLGNPNANSLPTCQLLRLHRTAAALNVDFTDGIPAIWIDSLLVPVEKGYDKKLALGRLCDYYQVAEKVLVLDSDLLHASQACSREELINRVFFSTWMRRLWTLEEGILSRENLVFQFRDGTVSMSQLSDSSHSSSSASGIGGTLDTNMRVLLPNLANYYRRPQSIRAQRPILAELLPILEYRSTTKAEDETLCIIHILGLDASRLLVTDNVNLRMGIFIRILAEHQNPFPMRFLFTKEPKLQLDGIRWAPVSFMALDREDVDYLNQDYNRFWTSSCDKGLLIHGMGGFTLPFGNETFKKVTFAEVDKKIFGLTPVPIGKNCRGGERFFSPQSLAEAVAIDPVQHWNGELQSMLGKSPNTTAVLSEPGCYGILVLAHDSEGEPGDPEGKLIYALPIGQLYMQELKTPSQNYPALGADSSAIRFTNTDWNFDETEKQMHEALDKIFEPETSTFLRCTAIDPSQRWCIG